MSAGYFEPQYCGNCGNLPAIVSFLGFRVYSSDYKIYYSRIYNRPAEFFIDGDYIVGDWDYDVFVLVTCPL